VTIRRPSPPQALPPRRDGAPPDPGAQGPSARLDTLLGLLARQAAREAWAAASTADRASNVVAPESGDV
jgi:hypothetical protein